MFFIQQPSALRPRAFLHTASSREKQAYSDAHARNGQIKRITPKTLPRRPQLYKLITYNLILPADHVPFGNTTDPCQNQSSQFFLRLAEIIKQHFASCRLKLNMELCMPRAPYPMLVVAGRQKSLRKQSSQLWLLGGSGVKIVAEFWMSVAAEIDPDFGCQVLLNYFPHQ